MLEDVKRETEERMTKTLESLEDELRGMRTGRASPALLERVMVDYYGAATPLKQLATISTPDPQMLLVRPYDVTSIAAIEKGILQADLGLNPGNDGRVIRVPVPRLTEDRRRDIVKMVKRRVEESKVALRNIRRDALEELREFEEEKLISEDELKRGQDELQKIVERYTKKVDEVGLRKEQEVMEI